MTLAYEVNFDGLVGMTHFYGGLSDGNLPSMKNSGKVSNPRAAALQGLNKMKLLASFGIRQAVLPPHERPFIPALETLGYQGNTSDIITKAARENPWLMGQVSSAAPMWTANAATVSPSIDSSDSHVHFTPANLSSFFHRSLEAATTGRILKAIFPNPVFFEHHDPLPSSELFFDEGAANHTRFCKNYQSPGVQLFTFGQIKKPDEEFTPKPKIFPARQTFEASDAIIRLHKLYPGHALFAQQNPEAIDQGAFHNDVISVGNQNVFLVHELAFLDQAELLLKLKNKVADVCDTDLMIIQAKSEEIPIKDAVQSYLFNSQLVTLPDGSMALIAPSSCQQSMSVMNFLKKVMDDNNNPIRRVHFIDLSQSMENGGGPACLRLRVVLQENELNEMNQSVLLTDRLYQRLVEFINTYYPQEISFKDLQDPKLYEKNCQALDALTKILNLGKIYPFQF